MMPLRVMMLALGLLVAIPAQAATQNPGEAATAAAAALEAASERLDAAKSANDRVKALTEAGGIKAGVEKLTLEQLRDLEQLDLR